MIFGIDFGTTNSLAAVVEGEGAIALTDGDKPHPSVIWYRGSDIVVGREARNHLDRDEGGEPPGFVRSPKMKLRREGPIHVDGRTVDPREAVALVLKHLKNHAAASRAGAEGYEIDRAVMTIPIDFGGQQRRDLRVAARAAGIAVVQFVHEPAAALYAHIRSMPEDERNRKLADLDGRFVLVFDWGGGTLDITLCKIQVGVIMQVMNAGDNEIGGDQFDLRLRNLFKEKHIRRHGLANAGDLNAHEQSGMSAKLLTQCELAKIELSNEEIDSTDIYIANYMRAEGAARNLEEQVTRDELEEATGGLVARGLGLIDTILERAQLSPQDIQLCLATGGMVNMPAIKNGLNKRFLGRVPNIDNGDRIIAEGAAWIAHDELRLTLSKPIEILVADTSGQGAYHTLLNVGEKLPLENETIKTENTRLFCVDPREGKAVIEIAKPARIGNAQPHDPRELLCVAAVPVDPNAEPLIERIECHLQIDHNYIAEIRLRSTGRGAEAAVSFHNLEFGLALPTPFKEGPADIDDKEIPRNIRGPARIVANARSNITQRTNVALKIREDMTTYELWRYVPGDIVMQWRENHFDNRSEDMSKRQQLERDFYIPCGTCKRLNSQIVAEGPIEACRGRRCGSHMRNPHHAAARQQNAQ